MGNLLTIVVFRNYDRGGPNNHLPSGGGGNSGRSPFNTILTTLVTFDSFNLIFSIFDSAYLNLCNLQEPQWCV